MPTIAMFLAEKRRLPNNCGAARCRAVRERLVSFLMLIGILFGVVLSPATAHAQISGSGHAGEVLLIHEAASTSAHDPAEKGPDMPGQPASHHHCTIALEVIAPVILAAPAMREGLRRPAISRSLASYAQAPPTEPPAA